MRKGTKKYLIVCCCLLGAGMLFALTGRVTGGRVYGVGIGPGGIWVNSPDAQDGKTNIRTYVEETLALDAFESMDITVDSGNFTLIPSDHYGVEYCVDSQYDVTVEVKGGRLTITEKWPLSYTNYYGAEWILWGLGRNSVFLNDSDMYKKEFISVYVPAEALFADVKIYNDYGDIKCSGLSADNLWIDADYGDIALDVVRSGSADITAGSGAITLSEFSEGDLKLANEYGNAKLENVTAKAMNIVMESGDLELSDAQGDSLHIEQEYGDIELVRVEVSGMAELINESGATSLSEVKAAEMQINNGYGNVKGKAVAVGTGKFLLESGSCDIDAFDVSDVQIEAEYGDVDIELSDKLGAYTFRLETEYGDISLGDTKMKDEAKLISGQGVKSLTIYNENGDITVMEKK